MFNLYDIINLKKIKLLRGKKSLNSRDKTGRSLNIEDESKKKKKVENCALFFQLKYKTTE